MPKYLDYTGLKTFKGKLDEIIPRDIEVAYDAEKATISLKDVNSNSLDSIDIAAAIGKTDTVAGQAGLLSAEDKAKLDALSSHKLFKIVSALPSKDDADDSTIYLVPNAQVEDGNVYDEYILVDGTTWEKIGEYKVDNDTITTVTKGTDTQGTNKYVEVTTNVTQNENDYTVNVTVKDDKLKEEIDKLLPKEGGTIKGTLTVADDLTVTGNINSNNNISVAGATAGTLTVAGKDITPSGDGNKYLADDGSYKTISTGVTKVGTLTGDIGLTEGQTAAGSVNLRVYDQNIKAEFVKGTTLADYDIGNAYTKLEVNNLLDDKADSADVYTQEQVDDKLNDYLKLSTGGTVSGDVTVNTLKTTTNKIEGSDSTAMSFGVGGVQVSKDGEDVLNIVNTGDGNLYLNNAGGYTNPSAYIELGTGESLDTTTLSHIKTSITVSSVTYQALIDNMVYSSTLKRQVAYVSNSNSIFTRVYANNTWTDWTGIPIETISDEEINGLFE